MKITTLIFLLILSTNVLAKHIRVPEMQVSFKSLASQEELLTQAFEQDIEELDKALGTRKWDIKLERLTQDEAQELFDDLKSRDTIPFDYTRDGCYARAHRMARIAMWKKINVGKIFIVGDLDPFTNDNWTWRYHVAPFVVVDMNGIDQIFVMDPSMFNTPVLVHEWVNKTVGNKRNSSFKIALRRRSAYGLSDVYSRAKKMFSIFDLISTGRTLRRYR